MEAQRSSHLGRVDTGHARKKILIFQYFLTFLLCKNKVLYFYTRLHDPSELKAQCCDHFDRC